MGPICDPFIPNIGLSGLPLTAPHEFPLHSHPGSQMARTDRPHLGAHIVLTWVPSGNVTWVVTRGPTKSRLHLNDTLADIGPSC